MSPFAVGPASTFRPIPKYCRYQRAIAYRPRSDDFFARVQTYWLKVEEHMPELSVSPTRRELMIGAAAAGAVAVIPGALHAATSSGDAIRPFSFSFPQADLDDLRRRVTATRFPDKEIVTDTTQGVQLATMQKLAKYWASDYDWSKMDAQ